MHRGINSNHVQSTLTSTDHYSFSCVSKWLSLVPPMFMFNLPPVNLQHCVCNVYVFSLYLSFTFTFVLSLTLASLRLFFQFNINQKCTYCVILFEFRIEWKPNSGFFFLCFSVRLWWQAIQRRSREIEWNSVFALNWFIYNVVFWASNFMHSKWWMAAIRCFERNLHCNNGYTSFTWDRLCVAELFLLFSLLFYMQTFIRNHSCVVVDVVCGTSHICYVPPVATFDYCACCVPIDDDDFDSRSQAIHLID